MYKKSVKTGADVRRRDFGDNKVVWAYKNGQSEE